MLESDLEKSKSRILEVLGVEHTAIFNKQLWVDMFEQVLKQSWRK